MLGRSLRILRVPQLSEPQRRSAWTSFWVVALVLAGHAMLETARDALFLARIQPERLPFVYLGIAVVSLLVVRAQARSRGSTSGTRVRLILVVAAALTLGFWLLGDALGDAGFYVLYVFSGVMVTAASPSPTSPAST